MVVLVTVVVGGSVVCVVEVVTVEELPVLQVSM